MAKFQSYFKVVEPKPATTNMQDSQNIGDAGAYVNYTWYQRLVQGSASRIARYQEFDKMDNDVQVSRALDTITREILGGANMEKTPLIIEFFSEKTNDKNHNQMVATLNTAVKYWCDMHDLELRLFKIIRATLKYGDTFFKRKNDIKKWEYVQPKNVMAAIVNQDDITDVVGWQVRSDTKHANSPYNYNFVGNANSISGNIETENLPATEMVWFSINDDLGDAAPFGESILKDAYRVQKQKELLEDSVIIYRLVRAPERRVFYIDVSKMPPNRVKGYMEQIKNEYRQKKVPSFGGGSSNQVDSVYNPESILENYFVPVRDGGKGTKIDTLSSSQNLGQLEDLDYFQNRVYEALKIPTSRIGYKDKTMFNDGRLGSAYIEEMDFFLYIKHLQKYFEKVFDKEFKRFMHVAGINVDPLTYRLKFPEPENFAKYRQQEMDAALLNTYSNATNISCLSPRFGLKRFAQLTDVEISENETLKCEEMGIDPKKDKEWLKKVYGNQEQLGMGGIGGGSIGGEMTASSPIETVGNLETQQNSENKITNFNN